MVSGLYGVNGYFSYFVINLGIEIIFFAGIFEGEVSLKGLVGYLVSSLILAVLFAVFLDSIVG